MVAVWKAPDAVRLEFLPEVVLSRASPADGSARSSLHGGGAVADPEAAGRPGEDHGRSFPGKSTWGGRHARWLAGLTFEHPAQCAASVSWSAALFAPSNPPQPLVRSRIASCVGSGTQAAVNSPVLEEYIDAYLDAAGIREVARLSRATGDVSVLAQQC